jgi:Spy/CpxP family protein refolding chaperone
MKNKWRIAIAACVASVTLATATASMQDQDGWINKRASGLFIRRIEQRLSITDAQRQQIKSILQAEQPTIYALAVRVQQENDQLISRSDFDEEYVRTFSQQHSATAADVLVEREKVRTEILQVLRPEQRQKLQLMRQTIRADFAERISSLGDQI